MEGKERPGTSEELGMGEWLSDRLEALQELQDEWNESEEGQAIAALGEALGDEEISLPPRARREGPAEDPDEA